MYGNLYRYRECEVLNDNNDYNANADYRQR